MAVRDDELGQRDDAVGYVPYLIIGLDEPADPLSVLYLSVIMLVSHVSYHEQELLQEDETIIEVGALHCSQNKLRDYFVTIRMKDAQIVEDSIEVFIFGLITVVLWFVVVGVQRNRVIDLSGDVQCKEGP